MGETGGREVISRSSSGLSHRHSRWEPSVLRLDVGARKAQLLLTLLWDTYEDHVNSLGCYLMMILTLDSLV